MLTHIIQSDLRSAEMLEFDYETERVKCSPMFGITEDRNSPSKDSIDRSEMARDSRFGQF